MKLGTENRNKLIAAIALGVVAVVLLAVEFGGWFGGSSPSAAASANSPARQLSLEVTGPQPGSRPRGASGRKQTPSQTLDPTLRYDLLKASEDTKYAGTGRNIFRVFVEPPPPPVVSPVIAQPTSPPVYQPPPPPPIELRFYGFATPTGGVKRIFLAHNEDVFIAKEGDIVNRRYKVLHISPNSVDILDVLSNNRQTIRLIQG